jgi:hypothetical protein
MALGPAVQADSQGANVKGGNGGSGAPGVVYVWY